MRQLKAYINKDVIKRMRHNDSDKTLYIVVPFNGDQELLETRFPNHWEQSLDMFTVWILTEQELLSVIDELKSSDTVFMFVLEPISKEDLKEKISESKYIHGGFNRTITYFQLSIDDIKRNGRGIKRLYTGR